MERIYYKKLPLYSEIIFKSKYTQYLIRNKK